MLFGAAAVSIAIKYLLYLSTCQADDLQILIAYISEQFNC